jgi:hypothetical protein
MPDEEQRVQLYRKFAAVAATVLLGWMLVSNPVLIRSTYLHPEDYDQSPDMSTQEGLTEEARTQRRRLRDLEREVIYLREDLYDVRRHYSIFMTLSLTTALLLIWTRALSSKTRAADVDVNKLAE